AEVPDDLGDLLDVAGAKLLGVRLESTRPVVRAVGHLRLAEDAENLFDLFLTDEVPDADLFDRGGRNHQREVTFVELQNEIALLRAKDFFVLDLLDRGDPVLWINNLVAHLVTLTASHVKTSLPSLAR